MGENTTFIPATDGFQFVNSFQNTFAGFTTSGLCGGMVYTALDYFNAHMTIPQQNYRPEEYTALQSYIYGRQETSILNNSAWVNWSINHNSTAAAANTFAQQMGLVINSINQGTPITLGLFGTNGSASHQVLVVGYNIIDSNSNDDQFFLYDPNFPGQTMTLVFDVDAQVFTEAEYPLHDEWAGFFADTTYVAQTPPTVPEPVYPNDGLIHELFTVVSTGGLGLSNEATANLGLQFTNGTTQLITNLNLGGQWLPNYSETVRSVLPTPIDPHTIAGITLFTQQPCYDSSGNWLAWDVTSTVVQAVGSGTWVLATGGTEQFICENLQGTNSSDSEALWIVQTPPTITGISPSEAFAGATLTITGTGFRTDGLTVVYFGAGSAAAPACSSSTECTVVVPPGENSVSVSVTVPTLYYSAGLAQPPVALPVFDVTGPEFTYIELACTYTAGCGGSIDVECTPDAAGDPMTVTAASAGAVAQTLNLSSSGFAQFIEGEATTFSACVEKSAGRGCNPAVVVTPDTLPCGTEGSSGGGGGGGSYGGPGGCVGRCPQ